MDPLIEGDMVGDGREWQRHQPVRENARRIDGCVLQIEDLLQRLAV